MTSALAVPLMRSTAAACSLPSSVSAPTVCVVLRGHPRARLARLGWPSSASSTAPGSMPRSGRPSCASRDSPGAGASRRSGGRRRERSYTMASLVRARAGMRASSASRQRLTVRVHASDHHDVAVRRDSPMTAAGRPQRRHDRQNVRQPLRLDDRQHPLLRLADHHLERRHVRARARQASRSTRMPVPARSAVSDVAQVSPAAPRSCMPSTRPPSMSSRRGLDQQLAPRTGRRSGRSGRIAAELLVERRAGQHGRAADAVATRGRAEQHGQVAGRRRDRARQMPSPRARPTPSR